MDYDFGPENITNNWKNDKIIKPYLICQYNKNKGSVDVCIQYTSYYANEIERTNGGTEFS